MSFRLLDERVAVIADPLEEQTDSGLFVPESGQSPLRYGVVAKIGSGRRSEHTGEPVPMDVQPGDKVFFPRLAGQPLKVEDVEYVFLSPREIMGVVDG
jgi:chaperonin GroES